MTEKTFCDRCGHEIIQGEESIKANFRTHTNTGWRQGKEKDYCESCASVIIPFLNKKKGEK